ncbi:MAG TPA: aminoacetone oxidase family FAD-binding enzyme, partial [Thermoanaerobaculia bacterium]|nr:aminoacetone oxidase family FAD-binding enzyme [Thermoanaerobaculia bacterium]
GIVVVGGGAAGLMAALRAAQAVGGEALVMEAAKEAGRKILVSGGGRCNVLPAEDTPSRFVSESPGRLVKRFLARWPLGEQRAFFESLLGAPLVLEAASKKLFPASNRSRDVRDALRYAVANTGAEIREGTPVREITRAGNAFSIRLDDGDMRARSVVLATGGRSVLASGADACGYDFAAALGHTVRPTYPALAPLVGNAPAHHALSGVSLRARVTARSGKGPGAESAVSEGGFLFTHRGWSGPAVLDVSHVVERAALAGRAFDVRVTFLPPERERGTGRGRDASNGPVRGASPGRSGSAEAVAKAWDELLLGATSSGSLLSSFLSRSSLPDRLIQLILATSGVMDVPLYRLTREARRCVVDALTAFPIPATGTEGYRTAEVTGGGVALEEVDPGSGKSRIVPGLFLAGEILDAFGPIGGFNFQWAWATGRTAGEGAARSAAARP